MTTATPKLPTENPMIRTKLYTATRSFIARLFLDSCR